MHFGDWEHFGGRNHAIKIYVIVKITSEAKQIARQAHIKTVEEN